jgi:hypothetical protein
LTTNPKVEASKVQRFLVEHWASSAEGLPELFYLTLDGLEKVCDSRFTRLSTAALDKTRRRLGLKSFTGSKLIVKEEFGKLGFYRPDGEPYDFLSTKPRYPWLLLDRSS